MNLPTLLREVAEVYVKTLRLRPTAFRVCPHRYAHLLRYATQKAQIKIDLLHVGGVPVVPYLKTNPPHIPVLVIDVGKLRRDVIWFPG